MYIYLSVAFAFLPDIDEHFYQTTYMNTKIKSFELYNFKLFNNNNSQSKSKR